MVDKDSTPERLVLNRTVTLKEATGKSAVPKDKSRKELQVRTGHKREHFYCFLNGVFEGEDAPLHGVRCTVACYVDGKTIVVSGVIVGPFVALPALCHDGSGVGWRAFPCVAVGPVVAITARR